MLPGGGRGRGEVGLLFRTAVGPCELGRRGFAGRGRGCLETAGIGSEGYTAGHHPKAVGAADEASGRGTANGGDESSVEDEVESTNASSSGDDNESSVEDEGESAEASSSGGGSSTEDEDLRYTRLSLPFWCY